ncbi:4-(cytidine 5'-diphospho)-2-C-methyl-D-erythritol kinase [Methylomonas paludis]|uniref:4-(cytidine 5'-diphospho)-2-C-methyl-D-erythritol kinase n=1 Tax=Methylomonas paludis TaxID=1173101 RepID=UPI001FE591EE|nr:4-(cytidine 5'-diphospho)-2-C-methyl-D-erythritol kinase [Methylomonas paludis]
MTENPAAIAGWREKWPAPAKLNLMLKITGRRADGYHLLQTVFQIIDLCDWLTFHPLSEDKVCLQEQIPGVAETDELTVRAAKLLKQHTGYAGGVRIELEKNLPMGGGLGGGSSDAATTLVVLNRLWDLRLSQQQLMQLGLQLGADVPIFVFGHSAWGEGVGEELQAITLPEYWLLIIKPDCHVNTRQIFLAEGLTRNSASIKMIDFIAGDYSNDCTAIVTSMYPEVKNAIRALSEFGEARLTGTGACVFAVFVDENAARAAYAALQSEWVVYLARGQNQSPLYKKLDRE